MQRAASYVTSKRGCVTIGPEFLYRIHTYILVLHTFFGDGGGVGGLFFALFLTRCYLQCFFSITRPFGSGCYWGKKKKLYLNLAVVVADLVGIGIRGKETLGFTSTETIKVY